MTNAGGLSGVLSYDDDKTTQGQAGLPEHARTLGL